MNEIIQYHHVSDEQINRVLNSLATSGYKIDLKKMEEGNFPKPDILERKGCEKIYIIERGSFWETRVIFNCGNHPEFVYLKVAINISNEFHREIVTFIDNESKTLKILKSNGEIELDSTDLALGAVYKNEYSNKSFDQFVKSFREDQKMILKKLDEMIK